MAVLRKPLMPHKRHNPQWIRRRGVGGVPLALPEHGAMA